MLEAMRSLAIDYLFKQLGEEDGQLDLEKWFRQVRHQRSGDILPFLVESGEKIDRVYLLKPDLTDESLVYLEAEDNNKEKQKRLPFVKPSGSQSAAIGPILKRTFKTKEKAAGPSVKILKTTKDEFETTAYADLPWSHYFGEIVSIIKRNKLQIPSGAIINAGEGHDYSNILEAAVGIIEEKSTVYLTVTDKLGRWPGDRPEYLMYLLTELANMKYLTQKTPISPNQECPLCGISEVSVYPNAVKGAGINISNVDREGAFPSIKKKFAWKRYSLCIDCADLLYIYKNHVAERFKTEIAGERALLIPYTRMDGKSRQRFFKHIEEKYVSAVPDGVAQREEALLSIIANEPDVTTLTIIWAKFGQSIEDLRGMITDILPSRLACISNFNQEAKSWNHPIFPLYPVKKFDLAMTCLLPFFRRPGGKKAKQINASNRLFQLKRSIIAALYRAEEIDASLFNQEIITTARWYLTDTIEEGSGWGLINEGVSKQNKEPYLTSAGWIRHIALLNFYLKKMGVLAMEETYYEPALDSLKPYFGPESGINNKAKAFAFLLGVLYGKVIQVQAARGVNVGANALTWLRRLTLTGRDLPELYVKIREKLLAYETESNEAVRSVVQEIGHLGVTLGSDIELDETGTCYFLLLGQSLATIILPSKSKNE